MPQKPHVSALAKVNAHIDAGDHNAPKAVDGKKRFRRCTISAPCRRLVHQVGDKWQMDAGNLTTTLPPGNAAPMLASAPDPKS